MARFPEAQIDPPDDYYEDPPEEKEESEREFDDYDLRDDDWPVNDPRVDFVYDPFRGR